jgi:hypothetical protein
MITIYNRNSDLSLSNFKGSKYYVCPSCGKPKLKLYCYEDGRPESEILGRCQREANCGYHLKPKEYFRDRGQTYTPTATFTKAKELLTYSIDPTIIEKLASNYKNGTLFQFLQRTGLDFSASFERYKVGATRTGATVFPQFDGLKYRAGKIINYLSDGHRDKSGLPAEWIHKKLNDLNPETHKLRQVFFGHHLIAEAQKVCIVESEKTALICATVFGGVWLATGGRTQLQPEKLAQLVGKDVFLFPDSDSVDYWREKTKSFGNCQIFDLSKFNEAQKKGADLADYLLEMGAEVQKQVYKTVINII